MTYLPMYPGQCIKSLSHISPSSAGRHRRLWFGLTTWLCPIAKPGFGPQWKTHGHWCFIPRRNLAKYRGMMTPHTRSKYDGSREARVSASAFGIKCAD